jgi:hypothetical protein
MRKDDAKMREKKNHFVLFASPDVLCVPKSLSNLCCQDNYLLFSIYYLAIQIRILPRNSNLSRHAGQNHDQQDYRQYKKDEAADLEPAVRPFALHFAGPAVDDDLKDFAVKAIRPGVDRQQ